MDKKIKLRIILKEDGYYYVQKRTNNILSSRWIDLIESIMAENKINHTKIKFLSEFEANVFLDTIKTHLNNTKLQHEKI